MHGDTRDSRLDYLELSGVKPGAYLDPEAVHTLDERERAAHPSRWPVEDGEEPIAAAVDLAAAKTRELTAHDAVMLADESTPPSIAKLNRPGRRLHHVGEQHGCEHPRRLGRVTGARQ